MRTEYLISIENKDNICKNEQSFANLLMINGDIKVDKNIIEYKGKFYTYKSKKYINKNPKNLNENKQDQKQNKKQKKEKSKKKKTEYNYFHITIGAEIDESNQSDIKAYESILRSIKIAVYKVTDKLQTIWDDVGFYYSKLAYPLMGSS